MTKFAVSCQEIFNGKLYFLCSVFGTLSDIYNGFFCENSKTLYDRFISAVDKLVKEITT